MWRWPMLLNALVERLKRRSKGDFKGRHFEASLILQAVSWYLRYPLSYRDIKELFLERGPEVDPGFTHQKSVVEPDAKPGSCESSPVLRGEAVSKSMRIVA